MLTFEEVEHVDLWKHPDSLWFKAYTKLFNGPNPNDTEYLSMLQDFANEYGIELTKKMKCSRSHLLERLK